MKNTYGNLIHDSILLGQLWKYRATGGELEEKREINLIKKIKSDRDMHQNDIIPFTYHDIDNIYNLATGFIDEWHEVFSFLNGYNDMHKDKDTKLKALARLYNLSKKVGYKNLNKMLCASMVYCKIFSNEVDLEELKKAIFAYSLPETVLILLEGLTPNEVYGLFPINKEYDGYKFETKDYFSCIKEAKEIGLNKEMDSKDTKQFVMDCNTHKFIMNTGVEIMMLVSDFENLSLFEMIQLFKEEDSKLHIVK